MKTYYSHRHADKTTQACKKQAKMSYAIQEWEYFGKICLKCETNLRHARDRSCVACSEVSNTHTLRKNVDWNSCVAIATGAVGTPILTMHMDRKVRAAAKLVGMATYIGCKCDRCGGNLRYTLRGRCVECVDGRNAAFRMRMGMRPIRPRKKKARTTPAVPADFDFLFE
jgi:hypothetical protein